MGRSRDIELTHNFTYYNDDSGNPRARCQHCIYDKYEKAERQLDHLRDCKVLRAKRRLERQEQGLEPEDNQPLPRGIRKHIREINKDQMAELHQLMADALYRDNRPFTLFHTPAMQRFLKKLILPS